QHSGARHDLPLRIRDRAADRSEEGLSRCAGTEANDDQEQECGEREESPHDLQTSRGEFLLSLRVLSTGFFASVGNSLELGGVCQYARSRWRDELSARGYRRGHD